MIRAKEALVVRPCRGTSSSNGSGKTYQREITRELFEKLISDIVDRTLGPCRDCMKDAGVTRSRSMKWCWWADPRAFRWCAARSKCCSARKPHTELNPDEVVALGAAVQAGILSGTVENQAAAGRDAAVAGHRDDRRRGVEDHSPQFDDSGERQRDSSRRRWTARPMC